MTNPFDRDGLSKALGDLTGGSKRRPESRGGQACVRKGARTEAGEASLPPAWARAGRTSVSETSPGRRRRLGNHPANGRAQTNRRTERRSPVLGKSFSIAIIRQWTVTSGMTEGPRSSQPPDYAGDPGSSQHSRRPSGRPAYGDTELVISALRSRCATPGSLPCVHRDERRGVVLVLHPAQSEAGTPGVLGPARGASSRVEGRGRAQPGHHRPDSQPRPRS